MKRRPKHELPVVPTANLVDIAILLIIFYMACSNFVSQSSAKIKPPQASDLTKLQEPLVLVTIDAKGTIRLGQEMPHAQAVESAIGELIKDKTGDGKNVMFRCDASIGRAVFEPVLEGIVDAGGVVVAVGDNIHTP